MLLFINMTLHRPLRSPPHMKKNIGSNLFFNTEHVAHIFTLLHYFMILLPTHHRFYISFFSTSYTLHIYITFSFLPLFICLLQIKVRSQCDRLSYNVHKWYRPMLMKQIAKSSTWINIINPNMIEFFVINNSILILNAEFDFFSNPLESCNEIHAKKVIYEKSDVIMEFLTFITGCKSFGL